MPVAWVWLKEDGEWLWKNLSLTGDVTVLVEEGNEITLELDASHSWDQDNDTITDWVWDINEDGSLGGVREEVGKELSVVLTLGKSYEFGLLVKDERGAYSEHPLDFTIQITSPAPEPDLVVDEVLFWNLDLQKSIFESGDVVIVQARVKNIGRMNTVDTFTVSFESSLDGGPYVSVEEIEIHDDIPTDNFQYLTHYWITGGPIEGEYRFRITADTHNDIQEMDEENNDHITDGVHIAAHPLSGDPNIFIQSITISQLTPWVNEFVDINITLVNNGTRDARFVDIQYLVDNDVINSTTIVNIPENGGAVTRTFFFSGDDAFSSYFLKFRIMDDGAVVDESQEYRIMMLSEDIPHAYIDSIVPDPVIHGQMVFFFGSGTGQHPIHRFLWISSEDGTLYDGPSMKFSIDNLSVGSHIISLWVQDDHGVWSRADNHELEVGSTGEPPVITITSSQNNTKVRGTITITGTVSSDLSIEYVEYRLNGGEDWISVTGTVNWFLELDTHELGDGEHVLDFRAWNRLTYSREVSMVIIVNNHEDDGGGGIGFMAVGIITVVIICVLAVIVVGRMKKNRNGQEIGKGHDERRAGPSSPSGEPNPLPPQIHGQYSTQSSPQTSDRHPAQSPPSIPEHGDRSTVPPP